MLKEAESPLSAEVIKALEEGIYYAEGLDPKAVKNRHTRLGNGFGLPMAGDG